MDIKCEEKLDKRKKAIKTLKNHIHDYDDGTRLVFHGAGIGEGHSGLTCKKCGKKVKRLYYNKKYIGYCLDCLNAI